MCLIVPAAAKEKKKYNPDETRTRNIDLRRVAAYPLAYRAGWVAPGQWRKRKKVVFLNNDLGNAVDALICSLWACVKLSKARAGLQSPYTKERFPFAPEFSPKK